MLDWKLCRCYLVGMFPLTQAHVIPAEGQIRNCRPAPEMKSKTIANSAFLSLSLSLSLFLSKNDDTCSQFWIHLNGTSVPAMSVKALEDLLGCPWHPPMRVLHW